MTDISLLKKKICHCITIISWTSCSLMLFEVKIPFHVSLLTSKPVCETGLDREPTNSNSFLNFLIVFIDVGCCVKIFSKALKSNTTLFARIFTGKPVSVFHFILIALCSL